MRGCDDADTSESEEAATLTLAEWLIETGRREARIRRCGTVATNKALMEIIEEMEIENAARR